MTNDEILDRANLIFSSGIESLKLYYMIGLPTEDDADLVAIRDLTLQLHAIMLKHARARGRIIVSAYVPLAEVTDYQNRLKALTGGEGGFTLQLSHYDPVPPRKQQELATAWKPAAGEE